MICYNKVAAQLNNFLKLAQALSWKSTGSFLLCFRYFREFSLVEVVSQQSELCIFRVRSSDGCAPFLLLGGTSGRAQKILEKKGKKDEKKSFSGVFGNINDTLSWTFGWGD